jgi:hypothetical protein
MVGLVSACSDAVLRDFVALRTSCVHQWHTLQSELQRSPSGVATQSGGSDNATTAPDAGFALGDSPLRAVSSPVHKNSSPYLHGSGDVAHIIPTASLTDLLQQTESMLTKLVSREKTTVAKLTRQLDEELARRMQSEARAVDLQQRVESLDAQLLAAQSSKHSTDQRSATEVSICATTDVPIRNLSCDGWVPVVASALVVCLVHCDANCACNTTSCTIYRCRPCSSGSVSSPPT